MEQDLSIDRFAPASDGDGILHVEWASVGSHLDWNAYVALGALGKPLVVRASEGERALVHTRISSTLGAALSLWDWVQVGLTVPLTAYQSSESVSGLDTSDLEGTALGDLRVIPKLRLYFHQASGFGLALLAPLTLPTATDSRFVGEKNLTGWPQLVASIAWRGLRVATNLGYFLREEVQLMDTRIGGELTASLGLGYQLPRIPLELNVGATLAFPATGDTNQADRNYVELLAGGSYSVGDYVELFATAGRGLSGGIGAPDFRAVLGVRVGRRRTSAYVVEPRLKETVVLLPDADGHVGAIEVDDGRGTTLLDTVYASTELAPGGQRVRKGRASEQTVAASTAHLEAVLPPADGDLDTIADAEDSCPDTAGPASDDPLRHGCPRTSEKVVVLPDPDGHVGAVEVDDGTSTTLLDTAYATSTLDETGSAHAGSTPETAVERALRQIQVSLPEADGDGDGVADDRDMCPERAGAASEDSLHHGCPKAAERLVLLPDADGHVGAVEVQIDGEVQLVNEAYAGAEIGADGGFELVPAAPGPVVEDAVTSFSALLPPADADDDGVLDAQDACPSRPGLTSANPLLRGCPKVKETVVLVPDQDGHIGSLEVVRGNQRTLLDKAFASFELTPNGEAHVVDAAPAAVQRSIADLTGLMSPPDADGDGVVDAHDACELRPGHTHTNPALHGCPPSVEKVVLLPDDDGHVGALQVGEGDAAFVLDTAYASAEIGVDGGAVQLETRATAVEEEFRETFAARSDYSGARIVIYFNKRAEPTLDVSQQVEDLVADLYGRVGYTIRVVGHTDSVGSRRANIRIGKARAAHVVEDLIAAGVPRDNIRTLSKGSAEPAVRVDDPSIPEFKNRRVEIFVTY